MKPPKAFYNVVQVQKNTKMFKILNCNRVSLYLSAFAKILQKNVNKDQKRHNANTRYSTTHEKSSKEIKSIPKPKTTKISKRVQKRKMLNGMCLE